MTTITAKVYTVSIDSYTSVDDQEDFNNKQARYAAFGDILSLSAYREGSGYQALLEHGKIYTVSGEQLLAMTVANISLKVEHTTDIQLNAAELLQKVGDKSISLTAGQGDTYNNKCEVHMPGQALSTYNDVMLLEDACTDSLQDSLNKGWRVISCQPQPDQRRPDYILGRFNPERGSDNTAARG